MGISRQLKKIWDELSDQDKDRLVRMAWEDRTSFEAIQEQYGLSPNEVERIMRQELDEKTYKRWRKRASEKGQLKQQKKRPDQVKRFKSSRQRMDGSTKGWK